MCIPVGADVDGKLCGDVIGEPCAFEVECQLPDGHEGDHYAEVHWPRHERQPPGPPTAMSRYLQAAWGPLLTQQLATQIIDASTLRPVVGRDRVVSRDAEIED